MADALERAATTPGLDVNSPNVMDFATALRLYGPAKFRRGGKFEWELTGDGRWATTGDRGAHWEIAGTGKSWMVGVACCERPDWSIESLELAKSLVAEIVARPKFPCGLMEEIREMKVPLE